MTDLPDDIQRAFADLPRERQPDPALEERVVRAVYAPQRRRWWVSAAVTATAAALILVVARPQSLRHPWVVPADAGNQYVLLLEQGSEYQWPPASGMPRREHEYALWADSLARLGKLDRGGKLLPRGEISGLFIIRAADDADAARIAATCPHIKYGGHVEVKRFE
jgi:hypothetical protein